MVDGGTVRRLWYPAANQHQLAAAAAAVYGHHPGHGYGGHPGHHHPQFGGYAPHMGGYGGYPGGYPGGGYPGGKGGGASIPFRFPSLHFIVTV